jgi:hypothetical protein
MDEPTICPICGHSFAACCHDAEAVAAFEAVLKENRGLKQEIEQWKMTTAKLRVMFNDMKADRKRFTRLKDAVSALIPHIHDDGMCGETDFEKRVMELEKRWKIVLGLEKDDPEPIPASATWHPATVLPPEDSGNCGYSIKVQVVDSGDVWSPCRCHLVTFRWYGPHGELLKPERWREVDGG